MKKFGLPLRLLLLCLFIAFDVYALRAFYQENHHLPFSIPSFLEDEITSVLPLGPVPLPDVLPLESNVEVSQSQWVGSIVYGKLTNHNTVPIANSSLRFSLSKSRDDVSVIKTYTATIAAILAPNESVYFSQRFQNLPTGSFWWSSQIVSTQEYTGQRLIATPSGQKISPNVIAPVTTSQSPLSKVDNGPWGVAKQISDVTWTIKVGQDDRMATPQETLLALNQYRQTHGVGPLTWDDNLARFAQERATYLNSIQSTDEHKGFKDYVANEDNVKKLGFWSLGENSGYGSKLIGVHLVEWIYAADEGHNKNQLDTRWSHVGIGIQGLGVAFIFGGDKI